MVTRQLGSDASRWWVDEVKEVIQLLRAGKPLVVQLFFRIGWESKDIQLSRSFQYQGGSEDNP